MDIRAVVFDLFGTLIDDSPPADYGTFLHETAAALLGERGWSPETYADWLIDALDHLLLEPA